MFHIPHRQYHKSLRCPNPQCDFVLKYVENEYPIINDRGYLVIQCPKCSSQTKVLVSNYDEFMIGRDNVVGTCDLEDKCSLEEISDIIEAETQIRTIAKEQIHIPDFHLWKTPNRDYEEICKEVLVQKRNEVEKELDKLKQAYLAGIRCLSDLRQLVVKTMLGENEEDGFCLAIKEVNSENDINTDNLVFVGHSSLRLENLVDGTYSRNQCFAILNNLLLRWKLLCKRVFIIAPFIGFDYKNQKYDMQVRNFWNWLNEVIDIKKTVMITRKNSFSRLKSAFDSSGQPYEDRRNWDELNELIKAGEFYKKDNSTYPLHFYDRFHAKFYAGVFDGFVEVLTGSYNLHEGESLENISLRRYSIDDFHKKFIQPFPLELNMEAMPDFMGQRAIIEIGHCGVKSPQVLKKQEFESLIGKINN